MLLVSEARTLVVVLRGGRGGHRVHRLAETSAVLKNGAGFRGNTKRHVAFFCPFTVGAGSLPRSLSFPVPILSTTSSKTTKTPTVLSNSTGHNMASSKKRKTAASTPAVQQPDGDSPVISNPIEYLDSFKRLQKSWPKDMKRLLDPSLSDERRSELWEMMCEGGDVLRQRCVIVNTTTAVVVCTAVG